MGSGGPRGVINAQVSQETVDVTCDIMASPDPVEIRTCSRPRPGQNQGAQPRGLALGVVLAAHAIRLGRAEDASCFYSGCHDAWLVRLMELVGLYVPVATELTRVHPM